jgi:hypothetical protein
MGTGVEDGKVITQFTIVVVDDQGNEKKVIGTTDLMNDDFIPCEKEDANIMTSMISGFNDFDLEMGSYDVYDFDYSYTLQDFALYNMDNYYEDYIDYIGLLKIELDVDLGVMTSQQLSENPFYISLRDFSMYRMSNQYQAYIDYLVKTYYVFITKKELASLDDYVNSSYYVSFKTFVNRNYKLFYLDWYNLALVNTTLRSFTEWMNVNEFEIISEPCIVNNDFEFPFVTIDYTEADYCADEIAKWRQYITDTVITNYHREIDHVINKFKKNYRTTCLNEMLFRRSIIVMM